MIRDKSKRKKHLELLRSSRVHVKKSRISNTRHLVITVVRYVLIGAAVVLFILYGIPYLSDVFHGTNPALRYTPRIEADFNLPQSSQSAVINAFKSDEVSSNYSLKNDPYMDGDNIIFSTDTDKSNGIFLNNIIIYNTKETSADKASSILPNVEKKYDNILETKLSGNYAVWVDSMVNGGGRICAYDLTAKQMFVVKEYAYAIPNLSVSGDYLAFMQVAGEDTQRIYLYNLKTRENVTVRLYNNADKSCGNVSLSAKDLVWSEYSTGNTAQLQRLVLQSPTAQYQNPDFGSSVYGPKTNGKDIVFSTKRTPDQGNLMLSVAGGQPVQIAQNPVQYEIGTNYVVYMKDQKIYIYGIDNTMKTSELTSQATRGILASANGNKVCFYDTTDAAGAIEIIRYVDLGEANG